MGSTVVSIDVANNLFSIILSVLLILGILIGAVAWFIRLESEVKFLKEDRSETRTHSAEKEKVLWEKMDSFQKTMHDVLIALGELKGRINKE